MINTHRTMTRKQASSSLGKRKVVSPVMIEQSFTPLVKPEQRDHPKSQQSWDCRGVGRQTPLGNTGGPGPTLSASSANTPGPRLSSSCFRGNISLCSNSSSYF